MCQKRQAKIYRSHAMCTARNDCRSSHRNFVVLFDAAPSTSHTKFPSRLKRPVAQQNTVKREDPNQDDNNRYHEGDGPPMLRLGSDLP